MNDDVGAVLCTPIERLVATQDSGGVVTTLSSPGPVKRGISDSIVQGHTDDSHGPATGMDTTDGARGGRHATTMRSCENRSGRLPTISDSLREMHPTRHSQ